MKRILLSSISMATIVCAMMTATLFSSCSSEDEQNTENQQPVELQIVSAINTRAANAAWTAGDKIGVFALKGTTQDYSNMSYSTEDGSGSFLPTAEDQTIMLPYDGSNYTIAAYYPYTAGLTNGSYAIDVSSQTDQEAIDLLVAAPVSGVNKMSPQAALDFYHKLVKIAITMKPGDGITAQQMAYMTVTISNQQTVGTCDVINNGDVVASGQASDITLLTSADGTTSEAILLPATTTDGMVITFSIPNAGDYTWKVNSAAKSQSFGAGNKYKYDITINKTGLDVNASIEDWADGNGGENGNAI